MTAIPGEPKFTAWPEQAKALSPAEIQQAYASGWQAVIPNPAAKARVRNVFAAQTGCGSITEVAERNGWKDSGAGKLVLPFLEATKRWPGCFPGDAQEVGSCVSHSTAKALLITLACELAAGKPDPLTGKVEGAPDVPPEGIASGVIAPMPIYWARGYNGDGWSCSEAAERVVDTVGCVVMKNYETLGVDFTNCKRSLETMYGSRKPPEAWQKEFATHRVQASMELDTGEEVRDALANGYGVSSCGGEGWSSNRDENGYSRRSGSWSHAMAYIGFDDRDETKQRHNGSPLVLIQNSWGEWNSGGRRIPGTEIDIPHGSFWARWSDCTRRDQYAFSNVNGWPGSPIDFSWL